MKNILQNIISKLQTRVLYDIMGYCEVNKIPDWLLTTNFEKAFNTIEWEFIDKTLEAFNFKLSFQKWVKLFFKDN